MAPTSEEYTSSPTWADVVPLPQDDGGQNALATISYTNEYRTAMSYLRAVMAANEHSPRVLSLTAHVISLNPAHYTVWLYRAKTLLVLNSDLRAELTWLDGVSAAHLKNYQIWHHRQLLVSELAAQAAAHGEKEQPPDGESKFLDDILRLDRKNYHVWSYRQWLVARFGLWEGWGEMESVSRWLAEDFRNNSAWNHRWFLVFGRTETKELPGEPSYTVPEEVWQQELTFAKECATIAPMNESAWSYLRGLVRWKQLPASELRSFVEQFAQLDVATSEEPGGQVTLGTERIRSSFALDILAEILAEEGGAHNITMAQHALELLATKYDPIRARYWRHRGSLLDASGAAKVIVPEHTRNILQAVT